MSANHHASILLAEDDEADVYLLQRAFKEAQIENPLHIAADGRECVELLEKQLRLTGAAEPVRLPWLILLDLKMPRMTGMDVLRWRRGQPLVLSVPAIVFSSSGNQHDVELAYQLGASAYIVKPSTTEKRNELARHLKGFWLDFNQPPLVSSEGVAVAKSFHDKSQLSQTTL